MPANDAHAMSRTGLSFWNPDLPIEDRVKRLVALLTLDEKIACLGTNPSVPRLGIKASGHVEGLHGLALGGPGKWGGDAPIPTTTFPQAIGMAETWDPELLRQAGAIEGYEARYLFQSANYQRGGLVIRAPNADLGREIRWGRNEECYGEDAWLNGVMVTAFVRGLQGDHPKYWQAAALLKHFLANSNENEREFSSSDFDQRLLHEYYALPFRMGIVEGGARAYMAAYNAYNGIPCTVQPILRDLTIKEWGQDGIICTDANAMSLMVTAHHYQTDLTMAAAASIKAGITQFLDDYSAAVYSALAEGLLTEADIDRVVKANFRVMMRLGLFDLPEQVPYTAIQGDALPWKRPEHQNFARLITQKSIVLLKNTPQLLPLDKTKIKSIAVIGPRANEVLCDWYSGTPPYTVTALDGIKAKVGAGVTVHYAPDNTRDHAVNLARAADVAIVCVGNHPTGNAGWAQCPTPSDGKEAVDRRAIILEQEELIKQVFRVNPRTVVVVMSSFPFAITWTQHHVPAIVHLTHNSQELGHALADVLFGDVNPGGRLVQTWPRSIEQLPPMLDYNIRNGRTYMYFKGEPLYPFGHGLSYTTFAYANLRCSAAQLAGDGEIIVQVDVQNTGDRAGDEVVQIYVKHLNSTVERPVKALKGFTRVTLQPQETRTIQIPLQGKTLAYWNAARQQFVVEDGEIFVMVGSSSADIRLEGKLRVTGCCLTPRLTPVVKSKATASAGAQTSPVTAAPKITAVQYRLDLPNGNYRVTATFGSETEAADALVQAAPRRLLLDPVVTAAGEFVTRAMIVNVKDGQLSLVFKGQQPRVKTFQLEQIEDVVTLYLAGDSTMTDQENEPYAGWGQMLARFFKPQVAVANHAQSGRAAKSFVWEKRLDAILATIKDGDYLLIQFGHNDQKPESPAYVEPFTTYQEALKVYIDAARSHGVHPILATSIQRRFFDEQGQIMNTHGDYPEAVRQLAAAEQVPLIDLHALSKEFFEALGPDASKKAFVHYPAGSFPGQDEDLYDNTHFSEYGAYELARLAAQTIRDSGIELAQYVVDDLPPQNLRK